jgi:anti-sigma28 factor (negative regulator of flagellin synthesis)
MAGSRESRAPFDNVTGTERNEMAELIFSLPRTNLQDSTTRVDERMDRVNRIRAAILNGYYRVRATDIALKLVDSMREGSGLRLRQEVADTTSVPSASVSSTAESSDATFRPSEASESAEETKHE